MRITYTIMISILNQVQQLSAIKEIHINTNIEFLKANEMHLHFTAI